MSTALRRVSLTAARLTGVLLVAMVLAVAGLYLAGISAGFDFTDEGFYYLSFAHPENVADNQTSFYFFGAKIFALLGHSIVAMRAATLAAMLGGTLVFLHGVRRFATAFAPELLPDRERWWLLQGSALVASFLGFAISPPALSYNFQNAACLLAATGLLLAACAQPRTEKALDPRALVLLAGFGGLVGLEFFIKFSSSLPLAAVGVVFFLLTSRKSAGTKAALVGALLLCPALVALAYFFFFQGFTRWWTGIAGTVGAIVDGGYATREIHRYGANIAELITTTLRNFAPVWVVALPDIAVVAALRARPRWQRFVAAIAGLWTLGHLLWLTDALDYLAQASLPFYLGTLALLALLAAGSGVAVPSTGADRPRGRWQIAAAGALLLLLPYIGAFGTNNVINLNCLYQLAPWFVIAALLLAEIDRVWRTAWPSRLGLLLLAAVAASHFYQGYWVHPYRVAGSRSEQTVPTAIGQPVSTLRVTPEVHEFITTTRRMLEEHGFKPGDDLLVFFNLPGFVFALGGSSPGHTWYFQGTENMLEMDLMRLGFIDPARRHRAFIVRNTANLDEFLPYLRRAGLNFPQDYRLITPPLTSPFTGVPFEIWQPQPTTADK